MSTGAPPYTFISNLQPGRVATSEPNVTKLERLGRSTAAILRFFEEADEHQVRVVVLDQAIDSGTPVGRLVRNVLASLAELEADLIASRTQDALDAFKNGTRTTRSGKPVSRPRRLSPEFVQRIREERGNRLKWATVAQHVEVPAGTCRKVPRASTGETVSVGDDPGES